MWYPSAKETPPKKTTKIHKKKKKHQQIKSPVAIFSPRLLLLQLLQAKRRAAHIIHGIHWKQSTPEAINRKFLSGPFSWFFRDI